MTKETALKLLNQFNLQNNLTREDLIQAFQLSLAVEDELQTKHFQQLYYDHMYDLFLEIVFNITQAEYVDLFLKYSQDWIDLYCCDFQNLYLAMIIKQKDHIPNFSLLLDALGDIANEIQHIDKNLLDKSMDELKSLYLFELDTYREHQKYIKLGRLALESNDLDVINKILLEIPLYLLRIRDSIYCHIFEVDAKIDSYSVDKYIHAIDNRYIRLQAQYLWAKQIHDTDTEKAKTIINSIDMRYRYGFEAYIAIKNENYDEIKNLLESIEQDLENEFISEFTFDTGILSIASEIISDYPMIAFDLMTKLHEPLAELLDIQESSVVALFLKGDIQRGLEYFEKIEVNHYKLSALYKTATKTFDSHILEMIILKANTFISNDQYHTILWKIYTEVNMKKQIPFKKFSHLAFKLKPAEHY